MDYPVLDARATGARIKELRKARHLTVEDVARFMGFESEQAVYKWQRGDSLPTVDNLYALSRLFGTTVDDILVGSIERDASPSFSVLWGIHANLVCECITYYIYAYQLRCPKQDVLRTLIKALYTFATEAKHTSLYALLQNRHPCRFWLECEQSSKNI